MAAIGRSSSSITGITCSVISRPTSSHPPLTACAVSVMYVFLRDDVCKQTGPTLLLVPLQVSYESSHHPPVQKITTEHLTAVQPFNRHTRPTWRSGDAFMTSFKRNTQTSKTAATMRQSRGRQRFTVKCKFRHHRVLTDRWTTNGGSSRRQLSNSDSCNQLPGDLRGLTWELSYEERSRTPLPSRKDSWWQQRRRLASVR